MTEHIAPMTGGTTGSRRRFGALRDIGTGMLAVSVKELRGRMRGKRAFVILTIYLLIVAGFAWMVESLTEQTYVNGFGGSLTAASDIGRGLFTGIVILLTIVTLILAPASTAGAISLEREKQTLDLLATTPISSLAIVLGKLASALAWIVLLLAASIPVVAIVFAFGGAAPDDVLRAYVVLLGTAVCFGSMGLFVSALVKRTQAATVINLVLTIVLTGGTAFLFIFWTAMTGSSGVLPDGTSKGDAVDQLFERPPEALMWLDPFVSQVDVICGTESNQFSASCQIVAAVMNKQNAFLDNGNGQVQGLTRDSYWPRSLAFMAFTAIIAIILSAQLVSPTRRWHPRLPRLRRKQATTEAEPVPSGGESS